MDNIITITLKEDPKEYKVEFESNPTLNELSLASLILDEILDHNFDRGQVLQSKGLVYHRIIDIEEITRI